MALIDVSPNKVRIVDRHRRDGVSCAHLVRVGYKTTVYTMTKKRRD
jgi:hypothetical protein